MNLQKDQPAAADAASPAEQVRLALGGRHVCPYCGGARSAGPEPCSRCTMEDTPATRQATKARIGPWYVLQSRNPAAPGMKYATLLALIQRGHVTARSVVRGPTTHQLWRFAAHVRGVSREFEVCYSCGGTIDRSASICSHCQRMQDPPSDPDVLLEPRVLRPRPEEDGPTHTQRLHNLNRARIDEQERNGDSQPRARVDLAMRDNGRVLSGMNLAAALQHGQEPAERPRRRKRTIVLMALLALGAAATVVLYLRPDLRVQTVAWVQRTWETVQTKWNTMTAARTPAQPDSLSATRPVQASRLSAPPEPAPQVKEPAPPPEPIAQEPATTPIVVTGPERTETPPRATPQPLPAGDPLEQARSLYRAAIDAEARKDDVTAVKLYQQIKQLPSETWPADLQLRLKFAQERVGQTSAN